MRILFVYPSDNRTFNSGISSLSAVLKRAGHETALYWTSGFDAASFDQRMATFRPDLVAVSAVTNQFPLAARLIERAKSSTGKPVILGGIHATLAPEEAVGTPGLDALCVGEGEGALLDFVERLAAGRPYDDIANLWIKTPAGIVRNPVRPLITDLDSLPDPDYEIFDYDIILEETGILMVFANRGCPYNCNYCVNHSLLQLYGPKSFVRFLSVGRLLSRIQGLFRRYPLAETLEFFDDTFILNRRWLAEFAERYPPAVGRPFYCNVRADLVDKEVVRLLKKAGCVRVNMAVETGTECLRREVLNKDVTDDDLKRAFGVFRKAGIRTYAHNMVGIPHETEENILRSIALNRILRVDDLQCWTFYPYPGTEAREVCLKNGWIVERGSVTVAGKNTLSSLDQPGIDYERVSYHFRTFRYRVLGDRAPKEEIPFDFMEAGGEESQMISGWHALESDGTMAFRWTKPEARLYLRNSGKRGLAVLANCFLPGPPPRLTIEVGERRVAEVESPQGRWGWIEADLPKSGESVLEIILRVESPFPASRLNPLDLRLLGIAVAQVRLEDDRERRARRDKQNPASSRP
jgi:radical SAM superfamily enzyme YgiQ (UPF0313 family)